MTTISKRVHNLEKQFGTADGKEQILLILCGPGRLALDQGRCIEILREAGFLPTGRMGIVDLGGIPDGLNAAELERYLREYGVGPQVRLKCRTN